MDLLLLLSLVCATAAWQESDECTTDAGGQHGHSACALSMLQYTRKPQFGQLSAATTDEVELSFEDYIARFGKSYGPPGSPGFEMRKEIYQENLKQIAEHNAQPGLTWVAGVNRFTDEFPEERHRRLGGFRAGTIPKLRSSRQTFTRPSYDVENLPRSISWRNVSGPIRNEEQCGACWAVAAASALQAHIKIGTGVDINISEQEIVDCVYSPGTCEAGGTLEAAFEYVKQNGISDNVTYPFLSGYNGGKAGLCKSKGPFGLTPIAGIKDWVHLPSNDPEALLVTLATIGPVAVGIDAKKGWDHYKGGIFDGCDASNSTLNHDALVIGYGEEDGVKYWLVQNGWNSDWGEHGFMRLLREDSEVCGMDVKEKGNKNCGQCGLLSDAIYPVGGFLYADTHGS